MSMANLACIGLTASAAQGFQMAYSQNARQQQSWNHQQKEKDNRWELKAVVSWKNNQNQSNQQTKKPQDRCMLAYPCVIPRASQEHGKNCILRGSTPSFLFNEQHYSTHQTSPRFMPWNGKAAIPTALPRYCPFFLLQLALKQIAYIFRGHLVLLAMLCTVSESFSCFLLPPTHLQKFQSLNWITTLSSRRCFNAHFESGSLGQNTAQNKDRLELCRHRNRIMKLYDIPSYLYLKWSHHTSQKSPDLYNFQIVYYTQTNKTVLKWCKKCFA